MDEQVAGTAPYSRAEQWLAGRSFGELFEINLQCLDYLAGMAEAGPASLPALFAGHAGAWRDLPGAARERLAASPYLLVDAGFDDEARWKGLTPRQVRDLPAAHVEPVFVGSGAGDFIRRVLVLGWHLARANPGLARVVLGMSPACAGRIGQLRLHDLDLLAAHRPGLVRPRWERQPRIWRHLLLAARDPDVRRLTEVSLRGLQLMAAGVLAGTDGLTPRARRG